MKCTTCGQEHPITSSFDGTCYGYLTHSQWEHNKRVNSRIRMWALIIFLAIVILSCVYS